MIFKGRFIEVILIYFLGLYIYTCLFVLHFILLVGHILKYHIYFNFQTLNPVWNEEFVFRVSKLLTLYL